MSLKEVFVQNALNRLLHGSGWDGKWEVRETAKHGFVCEIGFHAMNEWGNYEGWFYIKFHVTKSLEDFTMHFNASRYHRNKYITGNKEFYWDSFDYILPAVKNEVDEAMRVDVPLNPI